MEPIKHEASHADILARLDAIEAVLKQTVIPAHAGFRITAGLSAIMLKYGIGGMGEHDLVSNVGIDTAADDFPNWLDPNAPNNWTQPDGSKVV